ncbi:MAG: hypothetical protein ABTQ28_19390 [Thauera sp.]
MTSAFRDHAVGDVLDQLLDLTKIGESVGTRFTGGKDGSLWYYTELVEAFGGREPVGLEVAFRRDPAAVLELAEANN